MKLTLCAIVTLAASAAAAQDNTCAVDGFTPVARGDENALLATWQSEVPLGVPGVDTAVALTTNNEAHLTTDAGATLTSSVPLTYFGGDIWITDAVIGGVTGRLDVSNAAVAQASLTAVSFTSLDLAGGQLSFTATSASASLAGATLSGFATASFTDASGNVTFPSSPLTLDGGSTIVPSAAASETSFRAFVSSASVTTQSFAVAGDFGTQAVNGVASARSFVGRSATLTFDTTGVNGTARVTQVFDDSGPKMQADVEIAAFTPFVVVPNGGSFNVPMIVRNKSDEAVGVLGSIEVDGCAAQAVTPVVDTTMPDFVNVLVGIIQQSGWAAPFVAIAVAPALGVAVTVEAFADVASAFVSALSDIACGIFGGCGGGDSQPPPTPPIPFPRWLEPGAVSQFEVALLPTLSDGDYPVRVKFIGANYTEVDVDFTLRVGRGSAPPEWFCDVATYGTGDGCDCACGALDADCASDATVSSCSATSAQNCELGVDPGNIAQCKQPPPPPPGSSSSSSSDSGSNDGVLHQAFGCASTGASTSGVLALCALALRFTVRRRRGCQRH